MNNKKFWKQFAIALVLFLLGYFSFNSKLFANTPQEMGVSPVVVNEEQCPGVPAEPICYHFANDAVERAA